MPIKKAWLWILLVACCGLLQAQIGMLEESVTVMEKTELKIERGECLVYWKPVYCSFSGSGYRLEVLNGTKQGNMPVRSYSVNIDGQDVMAWPGKRDPGANWEGAIHLEERSILRVKLHGQPGEGITLHIWGEAGKVHASRIVGRPPSFRVLRQHAQTVVRPERPQPVVSLRVDKESLKIGQALKLSWDAQKAATVDFTSGDLGRVDKSGSALVWPEENTLFRIEAQDWGNVAAAEVLARVEGSAIVLEPKVEQKIVMPGQENAEAAARVLFAAIERGDLDRVMRDLPQLPDPKAKDVAGNSLIHALIAPRYIDLDEQPVVRMKRSGPLQNAPTVRSIKPVKMIRQGGDLDKRLALIRLLVGRGVPINGTNANGDTPLQLAMQYNEQMQILAWKIPKNADNWEMKPDPVQVERLIKSLLQLGADPNVRDARGNTPWFAASKELLPLMIRYGAPLEERDSNSMTRFLKAQPAEALALLELGADAQAINNQGRNRWFFLPVTLWEELAEKLLALRVPIDQRDTEGRSALMYCAEENMLGQARFLIEHGADINTADKKGWTVLHEAALKHNVKLMELLLQKGAAVNARSQYGQTPLHISRFRKDSSKLLLRYKADPGITDTRGESVLHDLAMNKTPVSLEMLSFFIRHGAPLNQKNKRGHTPLSLAYDYCNIRAMEMLLQAGADSSISEYPGFSLLDLAEREPSRDLFNLLRKYGARHKRPWTERHKQQLIWSYIGLGIFPLFTFLFSLYKPSPFTKRLLWFFIAPAFLGLLTIIAALSGRLSSGGSGGGYEMLVLMLAMPPLAALLMSLSGTRALADRCPPGLGIPLSFLNAAGCMGLTFGLVLAFFPGTHGEGGILLAYDAIFGGGAAAVITLIYAIVVWKKRLAPIKNANRAPGSTKNQADKTK